MGSLPPADDTSGIHCRAREVLFGISPRQGARFIQSLDTELIGITLEYVAHAPTLVYTFRIAGLERSLCLPLIAPIESIADLYPQASHHEMLLHQQYGLVFEPGDAQEKGGE